MEKAKITIKKLFLILIILLSASLSCTKTDEVTNSSGDCVRVGAICNDGTRSNATGSGACSHHGGVREWICQ